ncbi:MAG TPA: LuxR C-terminal-related transcriptional regulator [Candidatus Limnocylindrales bacterium]
MPEADGDLDPIIGRDVDLARVRDAIAAHRLVTLTAPGGSGKTRLARAVLHDVPDGREHAFVDASPLRETDLLASTILTALTPEPAAEAEPVTAIVSLLSGRHLLVVVDNLEQLPGAGAVIARLLEAAPGLSVLATSRVPLGQPGEIEIAVPPLALPAEDTPAGVEASPAGRLFLARARMAGRLVSLDPADAPAIAALVRRLDGIPLAIELAAARTRIMTPTELLARIERLGLRAIDPSGSDERRSMAAIIAWTMSLLDATEREVLAAAAACEGFDLDLLEAVCGGRDVVPALEHLATVALVGNPAVHEGHTRFRLLETVRDHVRATTPDPDALAAAHAWAVSARAEAAWAAIDGGDAGGAAAMELDIDNNRRAIIELTRIDADAALRLWRRMHPAWMNGRLHEAIERFDPIRAGLAAPTPELAKSLSNLAIYVRLARGSAAGRAIRQEAAHVAREVGDPLSLASSLAGLAEDAIIQGDVEEAERIAEELSRFSTDQPDARLHADEARVFVLLTLDGPLGDRAIPAFADMITIARRERRNDMVMAWLGNIAFLHLCRGEYEASLRAADESIAIARTQNQTYLPIQLAYRVTALAELGRLDEAAAVLSEVIGSDLAKASGPFSADILRAGAAVALAKDQPLLAARFASGSEHQALAQGDELDGGDRLLLERTMGEARRRSREIDVELAIRDGAQANLIDLLQALTDLLSGSPARDALPKDSPTLRHGELTRREVEILTLVGQGRSDPEIAELLFISPKTASVHVANIKGKLGVETRLEAALRARELGLT